MRVLRNVSMQRFTARARAYQINLHQSCIYLRSAQLRTKRLSFPGSQCYPDGIARQNARCKSVFKCDAFARRETFQRRGYL